MGRKEYGQLGLGKDQEPKSFVQLCTEGRVEGRVKSVDAGGSVSFAMTEDGLEYGVQSTALVLGVKMASGCLIK